MALLRDLITVCFSQAGPLISETNIREAMYASADRSFDIGYHISDAAVLLPAGPLTLGFLAYPR